MKNPKVGQLVSAKHGDRIWGLKKNMIGRITEVNEWENWTEVKVKFPDLEDRVFTLLRNEVRLVAEGSVTKKAGELSLRDTVMIVLNSDTKKAKGVPLVVHSLEENLTGGVVISTHFKENDESSVEFDFPWDQEVVVLK